MASENTKKKSIRVALIGSEHTVCEYSMFLRHLLVGLADESVPVALICPSGCSRDSVFAGAAEVICHPVFDLPLTEHLNINLLVEQLWKFEPNLLHCLCESRASLVKKLARRMKLPYVLTVNSLRGWWGQFPISFKRCAKIIVPAKTIADSVARAQPGFADRIEQINMGTFVAETSGCFSQSSQIATLVMAHSLDNADHFENVFNVLRHLRIDGYEFMMVVAGSGRDERQIRKLLTALDLLQIVTMVPRLRPWRSVLAAGDIFIRPQPSLVFDPSLMEAMSVGVAIAGCMGGVDDLIMEDRTAVVFDPNDELSILRSLKRLLDRREFAREIAKNAQQYLAENHTVSNMISAILRTYRQARLSH